mmetsp:Transcript_127848/g.331463  ORF Transcript_127848/g.331463 Transcript_127848/m.331463 type:complete len:213 (-) Transcript_127848:203-841(-)
MLIALIEPPTLSRLENLVPETREAQYRRAISRNYQGAHKPKPPLLRTMCWNQCPWCLNLGHCNLRHLQATFSQTHKQITALWVGRPITLTLFPVPIPLSPVVHRRCRCHIVMAPRTFAPTRWPRLPASCSAGQTQLYLYVTRLGVPPHGQELSTQSCPHALDLKEHFVELRELLKRSRAEQPRRAESRIEVFHDPLQRVVPQTQAGPLRIQC